MELMPAVEIGWLNGWLFVALLGLTDGFFFLLFPRGVVSRLWDRSGWSSRQTVFAVLGKAAALACLVLLFLTPLKIGSPVFLAGALLGALGLIGVGKALVDFRRTPAGEPATGGLYRISRHPQIVSASAVLLGACIAIGSWAALACLVVARVLSHLSILAEEAVCLEQYGESYRAYMARVPRYFLFF